MPFNVTRAIDMILGAAILLLILLGLYALGIVAVRPW